MTSEKLPAGAVRKDIYKAIEFVSGRALTESEHKQFKALINHYVLEYGQTIVANANPQEPAEHAYFCESCGGKKFGNGKKFKDMIKKNYLDSSRLAEVDKQRIKLIYESLNLGT